MSLPKRLELTCQHCRKQVIFDQPYPYHAGFSDQGFLYNDEGNLTLVWSSYDTKWTSIAGTRQPWYIDDEARKKMEVVLPAAPTGGRWRFSNSARCPHCRGKISGPMGETIYYLLYPGSVIVKSLGEIID